MAGKAIKPIDTAAIHRICSGQVVLDLATAVKELVENSLDAGATSIEIRLKEYGAELVEVADNGSGVAPENYQGLTLKYHTSKISSFEDLQSLSSFGFRGEALSSLCALANVSIVTRTKEEAIATRLVYDHSGIITSQEKLARAVGTTVAVAKLFTTLPVRHKEFNRNIRREYGRLLTVLQAYALIGKGIKLLCSNQTGRGGRTTVVQTQGNASIKDNIVTVFGTKTAACMEWLDLAVSENCFVEGFVSKPGSGCGRAAGDRQFFYVNGRPVDMPKVAKLLNELYRSFNSLQYPMLVLNFILPTTSYDVNVTPDKRKLFIHFESDLMVALREALEKVYSPNKYIYAVNKLDDVAISKDVASVAELNRSGRVCSNQVSNLEGSTSDGDDNTSDHEDGNEEDMVSQRNEVTRLGNTSSAGRFSADILSFQRKSSSSLNKKAASESGTGGGSFGGNLPIAKPTKKQATLTACLSRRKRGGEVNECLLSEQPLLKKWAKGGTAIRSATTRNEEESNSLSDSELEGDDLTERAPQSTHTGCRIVTTSSGSDVKNAAVPTMSPEILQKSVLDSPAMLSENEQIRAKLPTSMYKGQSSNLEPDGDSNREANYNGREPGVDTYGENRRTGSPETTVWRDSRAETVMIPPSAKSDTRSSTVSSHIELVAKGLADMRKKLAGSKLVSKASEIGPSCAASTRRVQLNADLATTPIAGYCDGAKTSTPQSGETESTCNETGIRLSLGYPTEEETCTGSPHLEEEWEPARSGLSIQFNIENLRRNFSRSCVLRDIKKEMTKRHELPTRTSCFTAATLASGGHDKEGREKEAALAAATTELERSFHKADFMRMQVLGQFNLGFILAKIDQDIFIVDQHASDEKYNFERLTKNTVLNKQPLLRPLPLELSAADEITVRTHFEIFRKNGFDFIEVEDAPTGQRLRLSAVPFSQNVTFGVGDVQELIFLLADQPVMSSEARSNPFRLSCHADGSSNNSAISGSTKWLPRPSRVRAMLASRACRSSIMIGDPLSRKQMERILSHLAELDSPWNCPHGRPTMRHLVDLSSVLRK